MFDTLISILGLVMGFGLLYLTYEGVRDNKLAMRGNNPGYITRDDYPRLFWVMVVLYAVVGGMLLFGSTIILLAGGV